MSLCRCVFVCLCVDVFVRVCVSVCEPVCEPVCASLCGGSWQCVFVQFVSLWRHVTCGGVSHALVGNNVNEKQPRRVRPVAEKNASG